MLIFSSVEPSHFFRWRRVNVLSSISTFTAQLYLIGNLLQLFLCSKQLRLFGGNES